MQDGWFRTSDVGRLDDDGRLWVTGRLDDVIISGGVKVPGAAVADRLKTHPLIEDAVVLGVPDEEWGERVVAFVVPKRADQRWPRRASSSTRVSGRRGSSSPWRRSRCCRTGSLTG